MTLFKKKIAFNQYISSALVYQFDFLDENFDKLLDTGETKFDQKERKRLRELTEALVVADLMVESAIHYPNNLTTEDAGAIVGSIYMQFLLEARNLSKSEANKKEKVLEELLDAYIKAGEQPNPAITDSKQKEMSIEDQLRFSLCSGFAHLFAGKDMRNQKKWTDDSFGSFKLAESIVKANLFEQGLGDNKITF